MTDVDYTMDQPDPLGMYTKVQNALVTGQTLETNRRTLEGGRAAGIAIQQATGADGTLDPEVGYSWIKANVAPEFQPAAVAAFQAAETNAVAIRAASAKAQQESIGYAGQYGGAFLATHPGGVTSEESNEYVSDLLANKSIQPITGVLLTRTLKKAKTDAERRIIIAQHYITSLGPAGMSERIPVTMKDGKPGFVTAGGLVAASVGGVKPKPIPLTSPIADRILEPGSAPEAIGGSEVVGTGQSAAQAVVASGASKADAEQRDLDIKASHGAATEEALLKNIMIEAATVKLGPYTPELLHLKAGINQLFPGEVFDIENIGRTELLTKTAAVLARRRGGAGTDMERGQAAMGSPNEHISNLGINLIIHQGLGDIEAVKIKGREVRKYAAGSKELGDFYLAWDDINPQVWQYASIADPEERDHLIGAHWDSKRQDWVPVPDPVTGKRLPLTLEQKATLDDFRADHDTAEANGWLKGIRQLPKLIPEAAQ